MTRTVFITGATGMIGSEVVRSFQERSDVRLILLMHRNGRGPDRPAPSPYIDRVDGDLTVPGLGLSPSDRQLVTASATHFLHAAACTRFDQALDDARRINVQGTRHAAELATSCPHLRRFGYVSTAYVCGRRTGNILEHELSHDAGFVNTYEQSKYEAEQMLRAEFVPLPVAVYRLSTILGDSRTGAVHSMTAPHQAIKILYHGLAPMMPGLPEYVVDLIPADFAGEMLARLTLHDEGDGRAFHVTASPERSVVLDELIDRTFQAFRRIDPGWSMRGYPRPTLASLETFDALAETVRESGDRVLTAVLDAVQHFARQLTYPKQFDRSNVASLIPGYDDELPDVREYYEKVVHSCVTTRWGRHAA